VKGGIMKKIIFVSIIILLIIINTSSLMAEDRELDQKIQECTYLLKEIMDMPDKSIPEDLLSKSSGIAIFPSVLKGGFIISGRYGKGIVLYHDKESGLWSPPAFYTVGGLSYGFQIGGQAIDLILVITNERGMKSFLSDKVSFGGDLAVSAGPVGRNVAADTDILMKASIFSYSRSKGIFAGVALKGAIMNPDNKSNRRYYNQDVSAEEILFRSKVAPTPTVSKLIEFLEIYSN